MATRRGVIKYNADNLRGGRVSDFEGITPQSFSVSEQGKYVQDNGNVVGLDITNMSPTYRGSIMPSTSSNQYKDMGVNIGQIYDGTNTSNNRIFFLTSTGNVIMLFLNVYTDLGVIIATSNTDGSIWTHTDNLGVEKVFVAGNTGGNFIIKTISNTGTGITTVHTNLINSNVKHRGVAGLLNRSYVTNGQFIMTYDPTANTYTNNKLNIGIGWESTSIRQYGNYMAITCFKSNSSSRLILWDGSAEFANFQYEINDQYATCFADGGELFIFTNGRNGTSKLYKFTGDDISGEPIFQTQGNGTNQSFVPEQGSVSAFRDGIYWRGATGTIFAYTKYKGIWGVHNPYSKTSYNVENNFPGICKSLYNNVLFVSGSEDTNAVSRTFLSGYAICPNAFNTQLTFFSFASEVMPHDSTINYIKFILTDFSDKGVGSTIPLINYNIKNCSTGEDYFDDGSSTLTWANVAAGFPSPLTPPNNYIYHVFNTNIPNIDIFRLAIRIKSCAIREIEVGYTYDDLSI